MTHVDPGMLGAKRATWRLANPRELLLRLIKENPGASQETMSRLFWNEVEDDKSLLEAICSYWFDNNYRSIMADGSKPKKKREVKAAVEQAKKKIYARAKIIFLELVMPNGKSLGQCTGKDCKTFDGWFSKLSEIVPAQKKVGDVLSEEMVRELWQEKK